MKEPFRSSTFSLLLSYSKRFKNPTASCCRLCSTQVKQEKVKYQNELFEAEKARQAKNIARIEKIVVQYKGNPKDQKLIMNKNMSTPYHCAQHMYEMLVRSSALALIDGKKLWDIHRPLEHDCTLELLTFKDEDPAHVNKAFWRTCSLMLGSVVKNAFKDHIEVHLHSYPRPNVRSGSFVYDVEIPSLPNWKPSVDELRIFSAEMVKLSSTNLPVERLTVSEKLADKIFEGCKYKLEQIPGVAEQSQDKNVVIYRVGNHIDMSRGPMIANTNFLGRCSITAVHRLEHDSANFYRFQGVAIPKGILINHFVFSVLEKRSQKRNAGRLPWEYEDIFQPQLEAAEVSVSV